jgi:CheY-like chemotaxis protein
MNRPRSGRKFNPVNWLLVEQLLVWWPDVVFAATEKDGLAVAGSPNPDFIVPNMRPADRDGIQILLGLDQHAATRDCPVVARSASAMPETATAARKAGAPD